jgi:hypothetical protein
MPDTLQLTQLLLPSTICDTTMKVFTVALIPCTRDNLCVPVTVMASQVASGPAPKSHPIVCISGAHFQYQLLLACSSSTNNRWHPLPVPAIAGTLFLYQSSQVDTPEAASTTDGHLGGLQEVC